MTNKAKAQALVELGFQVLPVNVNADGTRNYKFPWKSTIINKASADLIDTYWYGSHDPLVAVVTGSGSVDVLDIDEKHGKSGFTTLNSAGYTPTPTSYSYGTETGGAHYWYKAKGDAGPDSDINGLEGVDRRAGDGLAVVWGDVPTAEQLSNLPYGPAWMYKTDAPKQSPVQSSNPAYAPSEGFSGTVAEWMSQLTDGPWSEKVLEVMIAMNGQEISHGELLKMTGRLVGLGADNHAGVKEAILTVRDYYLRDEFNTAKYSTDFDNAFTGAIKGWGSFKSAEQVEEDEIQRMAEGIYKRNKAQSIAKRMEQAEFAIGTRRYSWEELEALTVDWVIEGAVAFHNNTMLVGDSNLGKTFLYIDWMCCSIAGIPWYGRKTNKAKFMVVLGEGATGYVDRIKAWCLEYGYNPADILKGIIPMATASLASEVDIAVMREVANEEAVDVIIFDTWSTNSGLSDENANAEAALAMNAASRIKSDAAVVIVHHPNTETAKTDHPKARGASAVQGKQDFVVTLFQQNRMSEHKGVNAKYLSISTEEENGGKSRHSERSRMDGLFLKDAMDTKVMAFETGVIFNSGDKILKVALAGGPLHIEGLMAATGLGKSTVTKHVNASSQVKVTPGLKNRMTYEWVELPVWNNNLI